MQKVITILTREQILEVDTYCAEHQISQSQYLDEHNIPRHQYYVWKRKYRQEELRPGGEFVSLMMPPAKTSGKAKAKTGSVENRESFLTVEIRTAATPRPHLAQTFSKPRPHLARTVPGVPESAPPVTLPPPNPARCPRINPTCHVYPAEPRPVSLKRHHLCHPRSVNAVGTTLLNFNFLRWSKFLTTSCQRFRLLMILLVGFEIEQGSGV